MFRLAALFMLGSIAVSEPSAAQTATTDTIKMVRTGWNEDYFAVVAAGAMPNPAGCTRADGYITHKSLPGYSTYYAAALTAYSLKRKVTLVSHNSECLLGWPKLIDINLIQE